MTILVDRTTIYREVSNKMKYKLMS